LTCASHENYILYEGGIACPKMSEHAAQVFQGCKGHVTCLSTLLLSSHVDELANLPHKFDSNSEQLIASKPAPKCSHKDSWSRRVKLDRLLSHDILLAVVARGFGAIHVPRNIVLGLSICGTAMDDAPPQQQFFYFGYPSG